MSALELDSSECGRVDGDAGVAFAFQLDRLVLANDFTAKFQRSAFVCDFDEFGRLARTRRRCRNDDGRLPTRSSSGGKFAVALFHASFDDRLQ